MPRSALHFSARCRMFRLALRAKLTRFEMLFVPSSAFFTRFLVLRGPWGVSFADFSQLLPLEPFDSARALSPSLPPVTLTPTDTGRDTWRAPGGGFTAFPGGQARSD